MARSLDGGTTWTTISASLVATNTSLTVGSSGTTSFRVRASRPGGQRRQLGDRIDDDAAAGPAVEQRRGLHRDVERDDVERLLGRFSEVREGGRGVGDLLIHRPLDRRRRPQGPTRGRVKVYVNGTYLTTVDLYAPTTQYRVLIWQHAWSTSATRTVRLVVIGTTTRPRIDLDAYATLK